MSRVCTRRLIPVWLSLISDRYRSFIWVPALMYSCLWSCIHPSVGALAPYTIVGDVRYDACAPIVTCIVLSLTRWPLIHIRETEAREGHEHSTRIRDDDCDYDNDQSSSPSRINRSPSIPSACWPLENGRVVRGRRHFDERMMR